MSEPKGPFDEAAKAVKEKLEAASARLAKANTELAFWKNTLRGLAEGNQLEGVDLKGKPSKEEEK